jgi:adenosylmethionine-8-amino-7-oxononanoate aminotransferase
MNHPVACAASLTNIEILKREKLIDNARVLGGYFLDELRSLSGHPIVGDVRGTGLWAALDLTTDRATHAPFPVDRLARIVDRARQHGMIIKFMSSALEFAPPLVITRPDLDEAIRILDRCLAEEERAMGV